MRWIWRVLVIVLLLLILINVSDNGDEQVYIKLTSTLKQLQEIVQDLPANIEVEIWKLFDDAVPKTNAQTI